MRIPENPFGKFGGWTNRTLHGTGCPTRGTFTEPALSGAEG